MGTIPQVRKHITARLSALRSVIEPSISSYNLNISGMPRPSMDMSSSVESELAAIRPLDELERAHLDDALGWVASGAQLYRVQKPATPPKHLVSYFAVIDSEYVLLVDHRNAQLWLPTGGHVEPDESPRTTVVRELEEELGLVVEVDQIGPPVMVTVTETVGLTRGHTDVSLWYAVTVSREAELSYDPAEFHSVRWFHFSEVPLERSDPHMGRFLEKLRGVAADCGASAS